jgi:hypothetical protein
MKISEGRREGSRNGCILCGLLPTFVCFIRVTLSSTRTA